MDEAVYRVMAEVEDRHWWFRGRRAIIRALLVRAAASPGTSVLDAGCGTGRNLELYSAIGPASGVDPSSDAVDYCRAVRGLNDVRVGDARQLPFDDESFVLVAATDVIEHVADDAAALAEMRRVATPGARLLLTVPAYAWLWSAEDERLQHHRRYTLPGLRRTAEAAGWAPAFGTYFNSLLLPVIAVARKLPGRRSGRPELERTPSALDGALSLPMRVEAAAIRKGLRLPAGVSVGLVCGTA